VDCYVCYFLSGTVWVFKNYSEAKSGCGDSTNCCDMNLMNYAYAVVVVDWIFMIIAVITILVTGFLLYCSRVNE